MAKKELEKPQIKTVAIGGATAGHVVVRYSLKTSPNYNSLGFDVELGLNIAPGEATDDAMKRVHEQVKEYFHNTVDGVMQDLNDTAQKAKSDATQKEKAAKSSDR